MIRSFLFALVLVVSFSPAREALGQGRSPSANNARRTGWFFNRGALRKVKSDRWVENVPTGQRFYREVDSNEQYLELHEAKGQRIYRVYESSLWAWAPAEKTWHLIANGRWDDPRKRPLDTALNNTERRKLNSPGDGTSFPRLGENFEVLAPADTGYNCIAWTLGVTDRWLWPAQPGQSITFDDFDRFYAKFGYKRTKEMDFSLEEGHDKIVLYGKVNDTNFLVPTHAARQMADGSWTSKLGKLPRIRHLHPEDLDGDSYGTPYIVYIRPKPKVLPVVLP
ncbi:MAG: hypothetical protein ACKO23_10420 [Gemmataceae bacterium]